MIDFAFITGEILYIFFSHWQTNFGYVSKTNLGRILSKMYTWRENFASLLWFENSMKRGWHSKSGSERDKHLNIGFSRGEKEIRYCWKFHCQCAKTAHMLKHYSLPYLGGSFTETSLKVITTFQSYYTHYSILIFLLDI